MSGTVVFVSSYLLVASCTQVVLKKYKALTTCPLSVVLVSYGIIIGLCVASSVSFASPSSSTSSAPSSDSYSTFTFAEFQVNAATSFADGVQSFASMSPSLALYLFLPSLIFESGSNLQWSRFRQVLPASFLLASLGIVFSFLPTAIFARYCCPYSFTWAEALTLGAVLSATDPVAVVSLMKELQAATWLSTLVESEALLNDGTAFVTFLVSTAVMKAQAQAALASASFQDDTAAADSAGTVILLLLQTSVASPLFGFACGLVLLTVLSGAGKHAQATVTMTVAAAYLCFAISNSPLSLSAILSVTVMALLFSRSRRLVIQQHIQESMNHVLEILVFCINSLTFLYTGIQCALVFTQTSMVIKSTDWGYLVAIYLLLHVVRYASILAFMPLFHASGVFIDWCAFTMIGYSGLRGGVSLLLALTVYFDGDYDLLFRQQFMFHVSGIVCLTLLFNGLTSRFLFQYLRLDTLDKPEIHAAYANAQIRLRQACQEILLQLYADEKYTTNVDWYLLDAFLPSASVVLLQKKMRDEDRRAEIFKAKHSHALHASNSLPSQLGMNSSSSTEETKSITIVHDSNSESLNMTSGSFGLASTGGHPKLTPLKDTRVGRVFSGEDSIFRNFLTPNHQRSDLELEDQMDDLEEQDPTSRLSAVDAAEDNLPDCDQYDDAEDEDAKEAKATVLQTQQEENHSEDSELVRRLLRGLQIEYKRQFAEDGLSHEALVALLASCAECIDQAHLASHWSLVAKRILQPVWLTRLHEWSMSRDSPATVHPSAIMETELSALPNLPSIHPSTIYNSGANTPSYSLTNSSRSSLSVRFFKALVHYVTHHIIFSYEKLMIECSLAVCTARLVMTDALRWEHEHKDATAARVQQRVKFLLFTASHHYHKACASIEAKRSILTRSACAALKRAELEAISTWVAKGFVSEHHAKRAVDECEFRWRSFLREQSRSTKSPTLYSAFDAFLSEMTSAPHLHRASIHIPSLMTDSEYTYVHSQVNSSPLVADEEANDVEAAQERKQANLPVAGSESKVEEQFAPLEESKQLAEKMQ